jgi:hypothetical protein
MIGSAADRSSVVPARRRFSFVHGILRLPGGAIRVTLCRCESQEIALLCRETTSLP